MKRVVFDGGVLATRPWTGVARAFLTTLAEYARGGEVDCVLLLTADAPTVDLGGVTVVRTGAVRDRLARQFALPRILRRMRADLLHSPVAAIPSHTPCPAIATIHDLPWRAAVPLREAGCSRRHRTATRLALRRATAIIVPSRSTRDALLTESADRRRAPIHVIPHGVIPPAEPAPPERLVGPFVAFADGRPRKNLERLRRAHALARRLCPDLPDLRVLGPGIEWVEDADRDEAVRRARGLIAVSLHEGFGLPVLEALGHGSPVVCSESSSLPEVANHSALLVDPTDERAIAEALIRIHTDVALRRELRERGLRRAAELTPSRAAEGWRSIHRECTE